MGRIARLPTGLANQIAAGEVVERPASVVKELVENALDAGASRIAVTVELGGKRLIRVEDDGEGMTAADAALAVERHATSKIGAVGDLAAIATFGFRGEALPSIASVSRLRLRTRARGEAGGVEVRVDGGAAAAVTAAGAPEGTVVEVRDLFYNVPARRKFLKSDGAETAQIARGLTRIALACVEVGVRLTSGRRTLLDCPPVSAFADRFFQIYGDRPDLVQVRKTAAGIRLSGLAAALAADGPVRGPQHLFVNRRPVTDRTVFHAIHDAYARATVKPRSPEVHLFLDLPPDRVDVNVHPAKAEVRFLEASLVHEVVRRAMADALGSAPPPQVALTPPPRPAPAEPRAASIPGIVAGMEAASRWGPATTVYAAAPAGAATARDRAEGDPGAAPAGSPAGPAGPDGSGGPGAPPPGSGGGAMGGVAERAAGRGDPAAAAAGYGALPAGPAGAGAALAWRAGADLPAPAPAAVGSTPLIPLGQFRDTFIIAVDADGVVIVDQHVAHERILFEQVSARLAAGEAGSQRLLEPVLIDLPAGARAALTTHADALARIGFEIDPFGGDSVRVTAAPAMLGRAACVDAVRALGDDLDGFVPGAGVGDAIGRIAASTACHAAVKANDRLTMEKMTWLLRELARTAYSTVCPHGRPVLLRLTRREIEKRFDRI